MFWRKSYQPFCICNSSAAPAFLFYISTFISKSISILYNLYRATSVHCDIWLLVVWHHQFTICLLIHSYSLGSFTLWHHRNMFIFLFYAYSLLKEFLYINNYPEDLFIFWEFTARQISNTINIRILWGSSETNTFLFEQVKICLFKFLFLFQILMKILLKKQ